MESKMKTLTFLFALTLVSLVHAQQSANGIPQHKADRPKSNPWTVTDTNSLSRLDSPITEKNSVLFDFGSGEFLKIPKFLVPDSLVPKDPKQAIKRDRISMSFQYPDMVASTYPSYLDIDIAKEEGRYVLQTDRFPVYIVWLFYQTQELGKAKTKMPVLEPESRPPQILLDQNAGIKESAGYFNLTYSPPTIVPSGFKGFDEVKFANIDKVGREKHLRDAREHGYDWDKLVGYYYVEEASNPYELYMHCESPDIPDAHECKAIVYIKSSHYQYRMLFPPEAIAHTDELIRSINKMIDSWISKK